MRDEALELAAVLDVAVELDPEAVARLGAAMIEGLDPDGSGYVAGTNPLSTVYGAPMIDVSRIYVYASDAHFTDADWELYKWTDLIDSFPRIKSWIDRLPLERLGIITIFYNEHYVPLGYHRDTNYFPLEKGNNAESFPHRQEFIWLRFDLDRTFCLFDINDMGLIANTVYVEGHSAFFNHHNWHGNFEPMDKSSLTVKIEGRFSAELRKKLGIDDLEYY